MVMRLEGVTQGTIEVDLVQIPSALFHHGQITGRFKFVHDAMHGTLPNSHLISHLAEANIGPACNTDQHVGMVRQERPRGRWFGYLEFITCHTRHVYRVMLRRASSPTLEVCWRHLATIRGVNPPIPRRQRRTSRDDGRRNMLQAVMELLDERDPDAITVRDIGERAGHHHRFVQDWFGGKAALYVEVLHITGTQMSGAVDIAGSQYNPQPHPTVIRGVKIINWLVANAPDQLTGDRMRPMVTRLERFFQDHFGVEPPDSTLLAQHSMLVVTGFMLFNDAYGLQPSDYQRLLALQFQLGQLLGTRSGN